MVIFSFSLSPPFRIYFSYDISFYLSVPRYYLFLTDVFCIFVDGEVEWCLTPMAAMAKMIPYTVDTNPDVEPHTPAQMVSRG